VIIFDSIRFLTKKVTKPKFIFFKKTETGSNKPVSVRLGSFFRAKTGLARFFWFGLVLARFGSGFSVWLGFLLVWVRFSLIFSVLDL
jgi:hypothetical protein